MTRAMPLLLAGLLSGCSLLLGGETLDVYETARTGRSAQHRPPLGPRDHR